MRIKQCYFWVIIAIFALSIAIFFLFFVKNKNSNIKVSFSELKEAKKQVEIRVLRYEQDIFNLDMDNYEQEIERLCKIYPPYLIEPESAKAMFEALQGYLQDTVIIALYQAAEKALNFENIVQELKTAFGYYKIFYPDYPIPVMITLIPGLDFEMPSIYIYDDILYVNVDMYLGANNPYYKAAGMPEYIFKRCDPLYLSIDIFKKAMVFKHFYRMPHATLLEAMITEGKKLFFTEMMFPELPEQYIIGYSEEQYRWANDYLGNVWSYLIEKNELFGKEEALLRCYIEEAPFTKPFGNDSPGRIGQFVGWKLIQSYMSNHPEHSLPDLMQETDYQNILNTAKFKPQPK